MSNNCFYWTKDNRQKLGSIKRTALIFTLFLSLVLRFLSKTAKKLPVIHPSSCHLHYRGNGQNVPVLNSGLNKYQNTIINVKNKTIQIEGKIPDLTTMAENCRKD